MKHKIVDEFLAHAKKIEDVETAKDFNTWLNTQMVLSFQLRETFNQVPNGLELPDVNDNYPRYVNHTDALEHLEQVWGKYLKCFNDELDRDYISQSDLERLDPKLLRALKNQIGKKNREGTMTKKVRDFIPPIRAKLDDAFEHFKPEDIKKIYSMSQIYLRRQNSGSAPS